jgi:hypothetical protein
MSRRFYTAICEFRGGTYVSQFSAASEVDAVRQWSAIIAKEKPIPRASGYVAKSALRWLALDFLPVRLEGLVGVWCFGALVGGDSVRCNLVLTADEAVG